MSVEIKDYSFIEKTDYCGIGDSANLQVASHSVSESNSVAEAHGPCGQIVAFHEYGSQKSASNDYKVAGTKALTIQLGKTKSVGDGEFFALNNVSISTSAGGETTVSASAESVPSASTAYFEAAGWSVDTSFCAKLLGDFAEQADHEDNAYYLQSANYTFSCSINKAQKEGEDIAWDISDGKIEASFEVMQIGGSLAEPSFPTIPEVGGAWCVSSPWSVSNPDSDYPTWSITFTKYLTKTSQS